CPCLSYAPWSLPFRDGFHYQAGHRLSMANRAPIADFVLVLHEPELRRLAVLFDACAEPGSFHHWGADGDIGPVEQHQHVVFDSVTRLTGKPANFKLLRFCEAHLAPIGANNRIHCGSPRSKGVRTSSVRS